MAQTINADDGVISGSAGLKWASDGTAILSLQTKGTTALTVDGSQNVGIGVTPSAWQSTRRVVQVGANGGALWGINSGAGTCFLSNNTYYDGTNFKYINTANATYYAQASDGKHEWYTAASGTAGNNATFSQNMVLDASGNLGVGTVSPAAVLHVTRNQTAATYIMADNNGTVNANTSSGFACAEGGSVSAFFRSLRDGTGHAQLYNAANSALVFGTNNAEKARITNGGDLLVAGTNSTGRITINQSSQSFYSQGLSFYFSGSSYWNIVNGTSDRLYYGYAGNDRAYVDSSTGAWTAVSDRRAKKNIVPIKYGLKEVLLLQPVSYNMNDDDDGQPQRLGFIAQDVMEVMEEAVDPPPTPDHMLGLDKSIIVPVLVKAIQEQQAMIKALEAKVAALESK
jgi:hypothetical protein